MRLVRGLGALLAILVALGGVPAALVLLGGDPLPSHLTWAGVEQVLSRPDDGTVLVGLITVIGWVAWAGFALALVTELVSALSGFRVHLTLPGLGAPQRLAAGLLVAVVALVVVPVPPVHAGSPSPQPSRVPPVAAHSAPVEVVRAPDTSSTPTTPEVQSEAAEPQATHVVERGDDLWSLAVHYYGHGREWRKIAAANPRLLTGGPDRLMPGWRLVIPEVRTDPRPAQDFVVVHPGESLSSIAEETYGEPSHWSDIFQANRAQITDPDEIQVGMRLRLPKLERPAHESAASGTHNEDTSTEDPAEGSRLSDAGSSSVNPRPTPSADADGPEPPSANPRPLPTMSSDPGPVAPSSEGPVGGVPAESDAQAAAPLVEVALGVASVGGLLAASVIGALAWRRRVQLQLRPVGRRVPAVRVEAQTVETALGHRQDPLGLSTLDLATRAIAVHCHSGSLPLPELLLAKVGADKIELVMSERATPAPVGFQVAARSWWVGRDDVSYLSSVPGIDQAVRPYPALVTLGRDENGCAVLADLEALGILVLDDHDSGWSGAVLAAMAVELSCSLWADEMTLTLVGVSADLPPALGKHNVAHTDDLDELLDRLEQRAVEQLHHQQPGPLGQHRIDPDLADPWAPEVLLIGGPVSGEQAERLLSVLTARPRVTVGAVVAAPVVGSRWSLEISEVPRDETQESAPQALRAVLTPGGVELEPQLLAATAQQALVELLSATEADETEAAPWWHDEEREVDRPPDNVMQLGRRFGGWGSSGVGEAEEVEAAMLETTESREHPVPHPILRILGPVELLGAQGGIPPRAEKQCLEYCGWLLEHPGTTAQAMAAALVVAEGTRRSNMSRLRGWLGSDVEGQPYLPDAYTGRIVLHPSVSSDWQRLQILTAAGVNRTSTGGLRAALQLVRGAPLADAAPGQWHWAEALRTDMISVVRDIGVEVSARALADHDIDLARWAASRALVAAPGDELLVAARIRTEHQAGNVAETERLTLQLAAQARLLGVDLDPDTVVLLQEVMEGRVRARMA